MSNNYS